MKFLEITNDRGVRLTCGASNNNAEYILTSARARDAYHEYVDRYDRLPSSKWYRSHFAFERIG